jgi:hypothetical protein
MSEKKFNWIMKQLSYFNLPDEKVAFLTGVIIGEASL